MTAKLTESNVGDAEGKELLTQSAEPGRTDQLHQLVVAHVSQQVLEASLSSQGRQLVAAATSAAASAGNRRVVQILVHLAAELLVFVRFGLLRTTVGRTKKVNVKQLLSKTEQRLNGIKTYCTFKIITNINDGILLMQL